MTDFKNTPELSESTEPAISYSTCYQQCFLSDNMDLMKTIESNTIDLIYCDIPYQGTKVYDSKLVFDYPKFWQWCRDMTKKGHKVFISEYNAPDDFTCVWQKEVNVSIRPTKTLVQTEKLFQYCL